MDIEKTPEEMAKFEERLNELKPGEYLEVVDAKGEPYYILRDPYNIDHQNLNFRVQKSLDDPVALMSDTPANQLSDMFNFIPNASDDGVFKLRSAEVPKEETNGTGNEQKTKNDEEPVIEQPKEDPVAKTMKVGDVKDPGLYEIRYVDEEKVTHPANLIVKEDGTYDVLDYKTGEIIPADKVNSESIEILDKNAYRTVADQYATISTSPQTTARLHGIGARDREDIHDTALEDFQRPLDGETIKAGEGIMWHTHVTQPSGSADRDDAGTYLPGQQIDLSTNPQFRSLLKNNIEKNVFGATIIEKNDVAAHFTAQRKEIEASGKFNKADYDALDPSPYYLSKNEFIATYASTGQYSVKDLSLTADALAKNGKEFGKTTAFFKGTLFESLLEEMGDTDYAAKAEEYQATANELKAQFKGIHDQINEWSGSASKANQATLQCILGKFEVTIGNIEKALLPACEAAKKFKDMLLDLKEKEEAYHNLLGDGENPNDRNLDKVKKELEELNGKKPDEKLSRQEADGEDDDGNTKYKTVWYDNPDYGIWKENVAKLEEEIKAIEEEIKAMEEELEQLMYDALEAYYQIKNFETTTTSYGQYFKSGTKQYKWLHGEGDKLDMEAIIRSHDDIVEDFEDYARMPVITNLSDYKPGDVIAFDDAHGYVYAVTGEFDPLTGTIKIACFDPTGKQVGSEISIWDQREIVPIQYVREYDPFYESYPDQFTTAPVEDTTAPPPVETTAGGGGPRHTTAPPAPTTVPPAPTTAPPAPTTVPPTPTTAPPAPTTTLPPVPPEPDTTAPYTIPYTETVYTGGPFGPYGPYGPHTGLDAISGTGDAKQSATGLGALAGLAAGAAGLGLTGLIGDKDEEEEEEKEESKELIEEEKVVEKKEEQTEEEKPQMF